MVDPIDLVANVLILKIKHFLILATGRSIPEATNEEFYQALSNVLLEEIMMNWNASIKSRQTAKVRTLYFLSMEYLPGKYDITHIENLEIIKAVLAKTHRNLNEIMYCEPEPGLGNGGLGRLSSCFLESLATKQYPAIAYGLRYQYGIFEQEIWNGKQVERPDCWLLTPNPWEIRKDMFAQSVFFRGKTIPKMNAHGEEVYHLEDYEEVRALPYDTPIKGYSEAFQCNVNTLRLWTTKESPKNFELQRYNAGQLDQAGENTSLTDVLYPNDNHEIGKRIRLKQEFLLVSASLKDIFRNYFQVFGDLSSFVDKVQIQINDTHPAMIIAELTRVLNKNYDVPWKQAWEITQTCCNYTNHTILKESLEEWNEKRVADLLPRQHMVIQKLNLEFCNRVRKQFPSDESRVKRMSIIENGQIRMSHLAILGSHKVNGVAELHTELLKKTLFKDFHELFPDKFLAITNGISPRRWLLHCNPLLEDFISKRIGREWITDFPQLIKLAPFASDKATQEEFLEIKKKNKRALFAFLEKENPIRDHKGKIIGHYPSFDTDALIDVQIKRFHEYKRQLLLALHLLILFNEIKENPQARKIKRFVVIGGKVAPGYEISKQILLLCFCVARKINNDPEVRKLLRVALIENYNVSKAEIIIPAADLSEQISTAGMEASGTGNMKLALNGALTIGTQDGANIEMKKEITEEWWPFSFGCTIEEIQQLRTSPKNLAWDIYLQEPYIRKALDALKDGSLVKSEAEHAALSSIFDNLLDGYYGKPRDQFFVIQDLPSYYATQKRVETLFLDPSDWAKTAINNMARMGAFSSDEVITHYAQKVWDLKPCPIDKEIWKKTKRDFTFMQPFMG